MPSIDTPPKSSKGNEIPPEYKYDFMYERSWLLLAMGFSPRTDVFYRTYVAFIFLFLAFVTYLSAAAVILADQKDFLADAIHSLLACSFTFSNLLHRRLRSKRISKTRDIILSGFYQYQDEEVEDEPRHMLGRTRARVLAGQRFFSCFMLLAILSNVFLFPGVQYLQSSGRDLAGTCNPYLPLCMVLPFSTHTITGWAAGYLINALTVVFIYGIGNANMEIYLGSNMQLYIQLSFLNKSIRNVFRRADRMYMRSAPQSASTSRPNELPEYQACLHKCLKANIEHYQQLKKFQETNKIFSGTVLLIIIVCSAIGIGARVYLLMQKISIGKLINYAASSSMEQSYGFFICLYGQKLIDESLKLHASLYSMPWYQGNKSFNKVVKIFMLMIQEPFKIRALPLNVVASIEIFGDLVAAMYKVSNLLRQSD